MGSSESEVVIDHKDLYRVEAHPFEKGYECSYCEQMVKVTFEDADQQEALDCSPLSSGPPAALLRGEPARCSPPVLSQDERKEIDAHHPAVLAHEAD